MNQTIVPEWLWVLCFGLTLLIEIGVMLVMRRWGEPKFASYEVGPLTMSLLGLNFVSHPLAWQANTLGLTWWLSEAIVVVGEAVGLALIVPAIRYWDAAKLSLGVNTVSGAFGLVWGIILD
jgi:hypothetical protein